MHLGKLSDFMAIAEILQFVTTLDLFFPEKHELTSFRLTTVHSRDFDIRLRCSSEKICSPQRDDVNTIRSPQGSRSVPTSRIQNTLFSF